jgi:hypothetical protein
MRARLLRVSELSESVGLPNVKEPPIRYIRDQLWEDSVQRKSGELRERST